MAAKIIDGKKISESIIADVKKQVFELKAKGINPCLAVLLAGNNPASSFYVKKKQEACALAGIESRLFCFNETVSEKELLEQVAELNADKSVHGILVQLPLPKHVDFVKIINSVAPKKDVDGFTAANIGNLALGIEELASCTPKGIIKLIESTGVQIEGKNCCIVNHSIVVGKPLALLLLNRNATVSVCNKFTKKLEAETRRADILITAVGKKGLIGKSGIKKGAIVIDAGIFIENSRTFGDVDFEQAKQQASFITPVPGGVGPMTVACLMENTVIACKKQTKGIE